MLPSRPAAWPEPDSPRACSPSRQPSLDRTPVGAPSIPHRRPHRGLPVPSMPVATHRVDGGTGTRRCYLPGPIPRRPRPVAILMNQARSANAAPVGRAASLIDLRRLVAWEAHVPHPAGADCVSWPQLPDAAGPNRFGPNRFGPDQTRPIHLRQRRLDWKSVSLNLASGI